MLALALVLLASSASAQTARLSVLADSLTIGEPVELAVAVDHPPGQSVIFPEAPAELPELEPSLRAGDAEILSVRRLPPTARGNLRTDSALVTIVVFAVDSARVGPIRVQLAAGADTVQIASPSVLVPVRSVLGGEANPEPAPLGPVAAFASPVPVLVGLGVLGALLVLGFIWILVRALRKPPAPTPRVLPYPEALSRLDALASRTPTTPEATEAHFDAIRDTLRTYLARRLDLPVLESTTSELTALLESDGRVPDAGLSAVRGVLRLTDLVAFAGLRPASEAASDARSKAREAIETVETALRQLEADDEGDSPAPPPPSRPDKAGENGETRSVAENSTL
ncbi:MAG: hypothetical protein AAF170_12090 [Bacteroidota bacterium]